MTIMLIAYVLGALYTFRYSGGNVGRLTENHHACYREMSHRCLNCNGDVYNHRRGVLRHCNDPLYNPHFYAFFPGVLFAAAWIVAVPAYFIKQSAHARGKEVTFFKEPPRIESAQDKLERRNAELEAELRETDKRLKDLGIEL